MIAKCNSCGKVKNDMIAEATKYAWKLYDDIMKSDCPIIEYGISEI